MATQRRDLVVVGASAGGVEALRELVHGLPRDFDATLFAVLHIAPDSPSILPQILARAGVLTARHPDASAADGPFQPRTIYVAPPDRHMVIEGDRVLAVIGDEGEPPPAGHRPAVPVRRAVPRRAA